MNDEFLKQLLEQADMRNALPEIDAESLTGAVRHTFRRTQQIRRNVLTACMVVVLTAMFYGGHVYQARQKQRQIARMQQQIQQLTQQTEATLSLVDNILARRQQQDERAMLNRRLASYTDPLESVQSQVDEAAAVLLFQADQQSLQPDRQNAAAESYRRILKYFPQTEAADTARHRLRQMQPTQTDSI